MKRNTAVLQSTAFDLLVVGAGVLGACVARDAAMRGLRVALIDAGDFGAATSANSLKIVHGGLRYLQQVDFRRMRASIRERSAWLRCAPHLVEPLPVVAPAWRTGKHRLPLLRTALAINDAVGHDRNHGLEPHRHIPPGRAISRDECISLVPELDSPELTGAVIFHDAQMYSAERLTLAVVRGAVEAGALVANHVECHAPLRRAGSLAGVHASDRISGEPLAITATHVVNAAGAAADAVAASLLGRPVAAPTAMSAAINLQIGPRGHVVAFSLPGGPAPDGTARHGARQLFVTPWRGTTLVGTGHFPLAAGEPAAAALDRAAAEFLEEVNRSLPGAAIREDEISLTHRGLLPVETAGSARLLRRHRVVDHAEDGAPALVTAIGVKYTTARLVAEHVVDLIFRKRGGPAPHCATSTTPLPGSPGEGLAALRERVRAEAGVAVDAEVLDHLVRSYGVEALIVLTRHRDVAGWADRLDPELPVIGAQVAHAVRHEMACSVEDVVCRRTELGARGRGHGAAVAAAASIMERALRMEPSQRLEAARSERPVDGLQA